jgi:cell division protein FtsL
MIWRFPIVVLMFILIIWLAISVVGNRYQARHLYTELQALEKQRDELNLTWSRFRLEKSASLNHTRIERQARDNLNMKMPDVIDIKVIRE